MNAFCATKSCDLRLRIGGQGMCCSVGHHTPAAVAALRSRLNHFRETDFVAEGEPMVGAALFDEPAWGVERLQAMLQSVLAEALTEIPPSRHPEVAIILHGPPSSRPGSPSAELEHQLADLIRGFGRSGPFHQASRFVAAGKCGIFDALRMARDLLHERGGPQAVVLGAVDSLLDAGAIEHFLAHDRIATAANTDGFIPGEAAAAILLTINAAPGPACWLEAAATSVDPWTQGSSEPQRALALTQVIRAAAQSAGSEVCGLDFHASGATGEAWCVREMSMALSRCLERRKDDFAHRWIAQFVGETASAAPVLTLAWLREAMDRPDAMPGANALLHFADDDGARVALVMRFRP